MLGLKRFSSTCGKASKLELVALAGEQTGYGFNPISSNEKGHQETQKYSLCKEEE